MAKIGKNNDAKSIKILSLIEKHLKANVQEVRETAALTIGLSWLPGDEKERAQGLRQLIGLVQDGPEGRKLVDSSEVDDRTRSFATYGLGLAMHASTSVDEKVKALEVFKGQLMDEKISNRNNKVAAINGIRLLHPDMSSSDEKMKKLVDDAVNTLWGYYEKKLGKSEQLIQAHVPPAIATLIGRGSSKLHQRFKDAFLKDLDTGGEQKLGLEIPQSCAVALGLMTERSKEDEKYVDALVKYVASGKDQMAKHFATIALAEIGGDKCRTALLDFFVKGNKAIDKPWAAVALGVLGYRALKEGGQNATIDVEVGRQLHATFKELSNPETQEAIAIGLGLMKYSDAADDLRDWLVKKKNQDELAGYLAIGLALMNDTKAKEEIRNIVKTSVRRPDLLKQTAIALGKLGDKTITDVLEEMLTTGDMSAAKLSAVADAYSYIGDKRTIQPLIKVLFDEKIPEIARAFTAAALGGIADKENLRWNSKIACDMNYRASVETLTGAGTGVLDIL
jgi:HEAT repeat protein